MDQAFDTNHAFHTNPNVGSVSHGTLIAPRRTKSCQGSRRQGRATRQAADCYANLTGEPDRDYASSRRVNFQEHPVIEP